MSMASFGSAAPSGPPPGGLFESAPQAAQILGSPFGSSSTAAPASGGLFGSSTVHYGGGGGLFGNSSAAASPGRGKGGRGPSLFGATKASGSEATTTGTSTGDPLQDLTSLQLFEGNWRWSAALEKILGISAQDAVNKATQAGLPPSILSSDLKDDILATGCAIAYMKTKLANDKDTWEMIVEKAEDWLREKVGDDFEALEKAVACCI